MSKNDIMRPVRIYGEGKNLYYRTSNGKKIVKTPLTKKELQKKFLNRKMSVKLLPYRITPDDRPRFKLIALTNVKDIIPVEETDEYLKAIKLTKKVEEKLKDIETKLGNKEELSEKEKKELPLLLEEKKIIDNVNLTERKKIEGVFDQEMSDLKLRPKNYSRSWLKEDRIDILVKFLNKLWTIDSQVKIAKIINEELKEPLVSINNKTKTNELLSSLVEKLTPEEYNKIIDGSEFIKLLGKSEKIKNPTSFPLFDGKGDKNSNEPLTALYNDEIDKFFEEYGSYGGTISADQINELPKRLPIGFIMNLDKSNEKGSHWVAVYIDQNSVEYFDPLADPPTAQFKKDIKKYIESMKLPNLLKFKVNKIKQQNSKTETCGFHSIRFLDDRFSGIPYDWSTRYKNNEKQGEKNVEKEFSFI